MIVFNKNSNTFLLQTPQSQYNISICGTPMGQYLGHSYYGKKTGADDLTYLTRQKEFPFADASIFREKVSFLDLFPQEYPMQGIGDFRPAALSITNANNNCAVDLKYKSHKIINGTIKLQGLPCVFANEDECQTLEIVTEDKLLGVEVSLFYTVFENLNVIIRFSKITNKGTQQVYINKALSCSFDMDDNDFDLITLCGAWGRERNIDRHKIHYGTQGVSSNRGVSSHQEHPFLAVLDKNADYNNGNVYGVNFIYSGNFTATVHKNQFDSIRVCMGINPESFSWQLNQNEFFITPQAVLVFSDSGLNKMTHDFHELYKNHLIRSPYKNKMRPILINNWEATYFDFDSDKLLSIAREAKKDGIEMLVMDDGWFGKRNFDDNSLGDWNVNEQKIKGGIKNLVQKVNEIGLKFGIWFEPEMICPDSNLFRTHPDWAIQIANREPSLSRQQLVLDITRKEVRDYIYECVAKILREANIEYVKWDMNRALTDIGSIELNGTHIGEFYHRYVLAVYELQERLITEFPNLLLENCSSGGGRFDPGMLYYSPQIWASDVTDAIERLQIQEGTSLIYPLSTMGAHVSVCPNHAVGRTTPFKTRGYVALSGTFGYELDITKISKEDRLEIPNQIQLYKKFNELIRNGTYWRLASYWQNNEYDCWMSVSKDLSKALITFVQVLYRPNYKTRFIKLQGLKEDATYTISFPDEKEKQCNPQKLTGKTLMTAGLPIERELGDFKAKLILLCKNS